MDLAEAVERAKRGQKSEIKCPAHDDGHASLSIGPGDQHPVVIKCFAGCETESILAAEHLDWAEVCAPLDTALTEEQWTPQGNASHRYEYRDENGAHLYDVFRVPQPGGGKSFAQRHYDHAQGKWVWNMKGVPRVLYRLPRILAALADGREVWFFEGEKDADLAAADGLAATTISQGVNGWDHVKDHVIKVLAGATVNIVADADIPGRAYATKVREALSDAGCRVSTYETPIPGAKDYYGHRQHDGTVETLVCTWTNAGVDAEDTGIDVLDFVDNEWPTGKEIVPGIIAEANVAVVVGPEGHGKTTLLRQFAACCAGGIHPFTLEPMDPLRVLVIDAENPEHQQQGDWRRLVNTINRRNRRSMERGRLTILSEWRAEPDLLSPLGQSWLNERIMLYKPQLVVMGPVQNLCSRDVKDDEVVRRFKAAVNNARSIMGTAFIIEHHAPHKQPGDKKRLMRPYGSSLFMKWPDFGYGLTETDEQGKYDLYPFRRPRVRARAWPEQLQWGTPGTLEMPWMSTEDVSGSTTVSRLGVA